MKFLLVNYWLYQFDLLGLGQSPGLNHICNFKFISAKFKVTYIGLSIL